MSDSVVDTVKQIKRAAKQAGVPFQLRRNGRHAIYTLGTLQIPIPRGRVHHRTVHLIFRQCEPMLGHGWWR